ncbi:hypothetical protein GC197_17985 [bacterium]|nr:hypothetical protein [bacterium]
MSIAILLLLFYDMNSSYEFRQYFRLGLIGATGFYLACGRIFWPLRWLLVALIVLFCSLPNRQEDIVMLFVQQLTLAILIAGFTFLIRMILAVVLGESSPRQRFTIFGVMLTTLIVASSVFALQSVNTFDEGSGQIFEFILILSTLGLSFSAQGIALWASRPIHWIIFVSLALVLAVAAPFVLFIGLNWSIGPPPPSGLDAFTWPLWGMLISFWLILYPASFALRGLGVELIDPGWKLGAVDTKPPRKRQDEDVDVLMQD